MITLDSRVFRQYVNQIDKLSDRSNIYFRNSTNSMRLPLFYPMPNLIRAVKCTSVCVTDAGAVRQAHYSRLHTRGRTVPHPDRRLQAPHPHPPPPSPRRAIPKAPPAPPLRRRGSPRPGPDPMANSNLPRRIIKVRAPAQISRPFSIRSFLSLTFLVSPWLDLCRRRSDCSASQVRELSFRWISAWFSCYFS
jgi:hypothetical protein